MVNITPCSRTHWWCYVLSFAFCLAGCTTPEAPPPRPYQSLAGEFEQATQDLLSTWYPRVLDGVHGGYLSDFNAGWQPEGPQRKMIVTQARHIWTASKAAKRYPDNPMFLEVARHGYDFLASHMWDATSGGFYHMVNQQGEVITTGGNEYKTAYGNAFAIYGLAAYAAASGSPEALNFAQKAFNWLDEHGHDPVHGGYYQFLEPDGTPLKTWVNGTPPKDQNNSIHLLEAFTELYAVWPDERVRTRLAEMLMLVRDTMVQDKSYLQLYFEPDWTPVSYRDSSSAVREAHYNLDHVSVGHDVETAFLMLEAAHALGINETETLEVGKSMVDHALRVGWDAEAGGLYDFVYYMPGETHASVVRDTKTWWAQAEGLNALLLMHTLFPSDPAQYFDQFTLLWQYCKENLIDDENGGWYSGGLDKEPRRKDMAKSHIWKGSYHTVRSLMHSTDMLNTLAGRSKE